MGGMPQVLGASLPHQPRGDLACTTLTFLLLCASSAFLVKKGPLCLSPLDFCEFMEANKNAGLWAEQRDEPGGSQAVSHDVSAVASLIGGYVLLPDTLFLLWVPNDEAPSCSSPRVGIIASLGSDSLVAEIPICL